MFIKDETPKVYHIRKPRKLSGFLKNRKHGRLAISDGTYCGALETQWDIRHSWRDIPCPGFELCQKCQELRRKKTEAAA
jgi:hypothetical protein